MLSSECIDELRSYWLPNLTDAGLARIVELLERGSPLLIHGAFSRSVPMGCLATQAAWHHPQTAHLSTGAGLTWLRCVAGLNPGSSRVIREWDASDRYSLDTRAEFLRHFRGELDRRRAEPATVEECVEQECALV